MSIKQRDQAGPLPAKPTSTGQPKTGQKHTHRRHKAGFLRRNSWLWLVIPLLLLGLAAVTLVTLGSSGTTGKVTAKTTAYDFGQVKMHEGLVSTKFQLTADSPALVTRLGTT
ncbi:MAG TPA: hypothetical protein VH186_36790 [Chloroflexia bacterium]|nr:hypothetical protein [Chloroflexia bacterium]